MRDYDINPNRSLKHFISAQNGFVMTVIRKSYLQIVILKLFTNKRHETQSLMTDLGLTTP